MEHGRSLNRRPVADHADMITELCEAGCTRPRLSSHRVHNQYLTPISAKENLSYGATGGYARPERREGRGGRERERERWLGHATARITRGGTEDARPGVYSQKLRDTGVSAIDLPAPGAYGILGESWAGRIIRTVCHQPRYLLAFYPDGPPSVRILNPLINSSPVKSLARNFFSFNRFTKLNGEGTRTRRRWGILERGVEGITMD